jgi:hypothetical protein
MENNNNFTNLRRTNANNANYPNKETRQQIETGLRRMNANNANYPNNESINNNTTNTNFTNMRRMNANSTSYPNNETYYQNTTGLRRMNANSEKYPNKDSRFGKNKFIKNYMKLGNTRQRAVLKYYKAMSHFGSATYDVLNLPTVSKWYSFK